MCNTTFYIRWQKPADGTRSESKTTGGRGIIKRNKERDGTRTDGRRCPRVGNKPGFAHVPTIKEGGKRSEADREIVRGDGHEKSIRLQMKRSGVGGDLAHCNQV